MTVTHAPGMTPSSAQPQTWPGRGAPTRGAATVFPVARLIRALGLGVVCSTLVGAPLSYLLVLLATALRAPVGNPGLIARATVVALVVVAAPLSVMLTHTPAGLRRRWLPVFLALELIVALLVGWFAGFIG